MGKIDPCLVYCISKKSLSMFKKLSLGFLCLALTLAFPLPILAETVIERVVRTGVLTVGTSTDQIPLSYVNDKGELVGYTIDYVTFLKKQLEEHLGREINLEFVEVPVEQRIPKLMAQELDLVCNSGFTWQRDKFVDFSLTMGIGGVQLLVKKDSQLVTPESWSGKKIAAASQSVEEQVIKVMQPQATIVNIESLDEAFKALEQSKVDALAGSGIILEGYRQTVSQPQGYRVIPDRPYSKVAMACMVPENNSKFLDLVNFSIVRLMQGYLDGETSSIEMVDRWFGKNGVISIDRDLIRNYFQEVVNSREQIFIPKN